MPPDFDATQLGGTNVKRPQTSVLRHEPIPLFSGNERFSRTMTRRPRPILAESRQVNCPEKAARDSAEPWANAG